LDNKSAPGSDVEDAIDDSPIPVQQAIPSLWRYVRPMADEQFAHPAERDFASILHYYRIRWAYEPTTFPLEWDEAGRATEFFAPDFYLPDLRLYIELTTMRQRLVTRKNRKLRRLRELYPDIRVKLLYRRDYHQFVELYLRPKRTGDRSTLGQLLFSGAEIAARVEALAGEIARSEIIDQAGQPILAIVAAPGANRFAALLDDALQEQGLAVEWDRVRLTRSRRDGGSAQVRLRARPRVDPRQRQVLIVTDIINTGLSTAYLNRWLRKQGARRVVICALLDRTDARLVDVPLAFRAFSAPGELVAGFGLSLRPQYAHLDAVHILKMEHEDSAEAGAKSA
jgi:hypoxanthine phosphoribosyltransferase